MKRGDRLDELFTLLFMVLTIVAGILYFTVKDSHLPFLICGGIAILLRIVQYLMRFLMLALFLFSKSRIQHGFGLGHDSHFGTVGEIVPVGKFCQESLHGAFFLDFHCCGINGFCFRLFGSVVARHGKET